MSFWHWDPSLSVGVDVIDGQHRRIIDYINELHEAKIKHDKGTVSQVLLGLVDYTRTHFIFEEDLMERSGYPLSDTHKSVHDAFVRHVSQYVKEHESGRDITRKLLSDLQVWLTSHIKNDDKDFAPYAAKTMNKGWVKRLLTKFFG